MSLFLGIDGGGTKTKITIINEHNDIVFENVSGPSSIDTVSNDVTLKNINLALKPYIENHPDCNFSGVFAGIGGIVFEEDCTQIELLLRTIPQIDKATPILAKNDMYNALYSGNEYDKAMTLICGTGMVAFGINQKCIHKCGGWGFKEGELGSGYHLGTEAIRHCIRAFDNRRDIDDFALEVAYSIDLHVASDIIDIMEQYFGQRTKTAKLAPIVTKHANLGNIFAREIVDFATKELALAVEAVYKTLQFNKVTLVIVGGLGNSDGYFKEKLHKHIKEISLNITIIEPIIDPSLAAAFAAKRLGVNL
jgi:N-acetylglucosamine kinase-like BadF-type ATPase